MILIVNVLVVITTSITSFVIGTYLNFSSYIVWMFEDPAWGPQIISQQLEGTVDDYFRANWFLHKTTMDIVQNMTAEQKAGQLFIPAWEQNMTIDEFISMARQYHVGGFMTLRNDAGVYETQIIKAALIQEIGEVSLDPWAAIDAEPSLLAYRIPSAGYVTQTADLESVEDIVLSAQEIAEIIDAYGYNLNFAPVYDSNHNTSVIGSRSFGSTSAEIIEQAGLFAQGMKEQGIVPVAKHFPGHGHAVGDTHNTLESVPGDLPERDAFAGAIASWVPVIMMGHLAVDGGLYDTAGLPATLSATTTDLLRDEMRFRGLIVTDGMNMGALDTFENQDVSALTAGVDMVLMPRELEQAYQQVVEAINTDQNFEEMINQKLYRIVRLKLVSQW